LLVITHPKPTRDLDALSISPFLVIDDNQLEFSTIIKSISLISRFIQETPLDVFILEIDQSNNYILRYEHVGALTYK
jgi:hypothetical protein